MTRPGDTPFVNDYVSGDERGAAHLAGDPEYTRAPTPAQRIVSLNSRLRNLRAMPQSPETDQWILRLERELIEIRAAVDLDGLD